MTVAGVHNDTKAGKYRSLQQPCKRLNVKNFPTVVLLLFYCLLFEVSAIPMFKGFPHCKVAGSMGSLASFLGKLNDMTATSSVLNRDILLDGVC